MKYLRIINNKPSKTLSSISLHNILTVKFARCFSFRQIFWRDQNLKNGVLRRIQIPSLIKDYSTVTQRFEYLWGSNMHQFFIKKSKVLQINFLLLIEISCECCELVEQQCVLWKGNSWSYQVLLSKSSTQNEQDLYLSTRNSSLISQVPRSIFLVYPIRSTWSKCI